MKLLLIDIGPAGALYVKRSDLAHHVSSILEVGSFVPVFPTFPALPAPLQACFLTGLYAEEHGVLAEPPLEDSTLRVPTLPHRRVEWTDPKFDADLTFTRLPHMDEAAKRSNPRELFDVFKQVDRIVGELSKAAEAQGIETVVVSEGNMFPVENAIPINRRFKERGWSAKDVVAVPDHQVARVFCAPSLIREAAKSVDKGVRVLCTAEQKAAYRFNHPRAGDLVLIAPTKSWFSAEGDGSVAGSRGALPISGDDYGFFVSSVPVRSIGARPFVTAPEVASLLQELMNR